MENNFYLELYDKILMLNNKKILIIFYKDKNIWFSYNDILKALEYKQIEEFKTNIKIDKKVRLIWY